MTALAADTEGVRASTGRPAAARRYVPIIALLAGAGLLLCAVANALSRSSNGHPELIYWAGVLLIAVPIFFRLTSSEASVAERIGLVCMLGISLYLVKVIRDAPLFTFSDELVHAFNANRISETHHLFHKNPIIPVTPLYPGLEGATSALMNLTGMSSYGAGIVVIGAARIIMVLGLFFLFERISHSARTAGLAVAIYTGNFNFLFWSGQYSYESLALPLLVVVLMAVSERESTSLDWGRSWSVPIVLGIAAIVVTHHLTSYSLAIILLALSLAYRLLRKTWKPPNAWPFALLAALLSLAWLVVVASATVGYLSPVITSAIEAVVNTAGGSAPPRALFQNKTPGVEATPLIARAVSLLAVMLLFAGLPFGLRRVWQRYRNQPFVWLFALGAIGFFGTVALRLAPDAWETGNRASDFLFIGLAFVLASIGLETWKPVRRKPLAKILSGRYLVTGALGILLVGGAISGWPWDSQVVSPLRVSAEGRTIVSPPLAMAEWAKEHAPEGDFAASVADSRLLLDPAGKIAIAGQSPDVKDILESAKLENWQLPLLRENNLRFVVADRRRISGDGARGYFFTFKGLDPEELLPATAITKFDQLPNASRIYTNGSIAVYDLDGPR